MFSLAVAGRPWCLLLVLCLFLALVSARRFVLNISHAPLWCVSPCVPVLAVHVGVSACLPLCRRAARYCRARSLLLTDREMIFASTSFPSAHGIASHMAARVGSSFPFPSVFSSPSPPRSSSPSSSAFASAVVPAGNPAPPFHRQAPPFVFAFPTISARRVDMARMKGEEARAPR
jgi:hypothetical protein